MISKLISPLEYPLIILVVAWFLQRSAWFAKRNASDRDPGRKMLTTAVLVGCITYAQTWHNEIGAAWLNHDNLAVVLTLAVFAILSFAFRLEEKRQLAASTSAASPPAPSHRARENT
jgi:hypothetical protein